MAFPSMQSFSTRLMQPCRAAVVLWYILVVVESENVSNASQNVSHGCPVVDDDQIMCSLNGLEELVKRQSFKILNHFGSFQEYCEIGRTMMEQWMDSDLPAAGVPGADNLTFESLTKWQYQPGAYTYVDLATPCPPDKSEIRQCDEYGNCRCTALANTAWMYDCGGANMTNGTDGTVGSYPDINCWYWADRSPNRIMESYFPGWAYNYSYNFVETSLQSKDGVHYGQFAKPHRAQRDLDLTIPYTSPDFGEITKVCAERWPDCPNNTLENPITVAKWKEDGNIVVQKGECWADPTCRASIENKKLCPRMCLDPGSFGNNMITFILAMASPLWGMFNDLYPRYKEHCVSWYWWGNRGEGLYFPGFAPFDMGDFVEWDFQFPKMHFAGPQFNPNRTGTWTPTYLDGVSGNLMITPIVPVYIGDYWQGTVSADLTMTRTQKIVENVKGTENGHCILTMEKGHVVAAGQITFDVLFCPNRNQPECTCNEEYQAIKAGVAGSCSNTSINDRFALDKSWNPELQANKGKQGAEGIKIQEVAPFKGGLLTFVNEVFLEEDKGVQLIYFCPDAIEPAEGMEPPPCTIEYWAVWQKLEGKYAEYIPWKLLVLVPKLELESEAVWSVVPNNVYSLAYESQTVTLKNTGSRSVKWKAADIDGFSASPSSGWLCADSEIDIEVSQDRAIIEPQLSSNITSSLFTIESANESRTCFANLDVNFVFKITDCEAGFYPRSMGECEPCAAGAFAEEAGMSECLDCPLGKYNERRGQSNCSLCEPIISDSTTPFPAAARERDCECPSGRYYHRDTVDGVLSKPKCLPCKEGMVCNGGNEPPLQEAGFKAEIVGGSETLGTGIYSVYRCKNTMQCPEGRAGSCAKGREGTACAKCQENHYRGSKGQCDECQGADTVPFIICIFCMCLCMIPLYIYASADVSKQQLTTVTATLTLGQLAIAVQALGVFREIEVEWVEPVTGMLNFIKLLAFDLDVIKIQCLFRQDDPSLNLFFTLLLFPGFMLALAAMVTALKFMGRPALSFDRYLNSVGLVALIVYISITITVLRPLHCLKNPNGTSSMASNPSVICWDSSVHTWLVVLGVIGILMYPISILGNVLYITVRYKSLIADGRGLKILDRYRFLFHRFQPVTYFWGFCYLFRNFLISISPVVFPEHAIWQVISIDVILLVSLLFTAYLMPWRTNMANISELGTTIGLAIFMQVAAFFVDIDMEVGKSVLGGVCLSVFILVALVGLTTVVFALYRRCFVHHAYGAFLCHHKEGAASLGRYFKMRISSISNSILFLDSDQLEELDLIFDTVRTRSKNLLIIHTKQTTQRPWCAGEITTAVRNGIPIVQIACDDYVPPDEAMLEQLDNIWSEQQKFTLGQYGIELPMIKEAYRHLVTLETIPLKRFSPAAEQEKAIRLAAEKCDLPRKLGASMGSNSNGSVVDARILVVGTTGDAEGRTTCEVLREMVQEKMRVVTSAVFSPKEAEPHLASAEYLLVVLSRGLLDDYMFGDVLLSLERTRHAEPLEIVTVIADNFFQFPSPDFYGNLEREGGRNARLAAAYKRMLNILGLPFSPHGSWAIMTTQASEICRRFRRCQEGVPVVTHTFDLNAKDEDTAKGDVMGI